MIGRAGASDRLRTALWLALGGAPALALWRLPAPEVQLQWLAATGPLIVLLNLAIVGALATGLVRAAFGRPAIPAPGRLSRLAPLLPPVLLAMVVAFLALLVQGRMRVLADEYLIAGVSMGLGLQGLPLAPSAGMFDPQGTLAVFAATFDKRGLVVPILIAIPHWLLGYQFGHGFAFNLVAGWLALLGMYGLLRLNLGRVGACSGALLLAALPPFAWSVRSISLEPLNLAVVLAMGICAHRAVAERSARHAWLLVWLAPLAAQVRYESALLGAFALPIGAYVLGAPARSARSNWPLALLPFAYLPFAWQRAIPLDFQLELSAIGADHGFGIDLALAHAYGLARLLAVGSPVNPFGPLSLVAAACALVFGGVRLARAWQAQSPQRVGDAVLAISALSLSFGILAYAWSDPFQPATLRLMLPLLAFLCVATSGLVHALGARFGWGERALALVALAAFAWAIPAIQSDRIYDRLALGPALNGAYDFMHQTRPGCRYAYVAENSAYFLARGEDALPPKLLTPYWARLQQGVAAGRIEGALLVRPMDLTRRAFVYDATVPPGYASRQLASIGVNPGAGFRIDALDRDSDPMPAARHAGCGIELPAAGAEHPPAADSDPGKATGQ